MTISVPATHLVMRRLHVGAHRTRPRAPRRIAPAPRSVMPRIRRGSRPLQRRPSARCSRRGRSGSQPRPACRGCAMTPPSAESSFGPHRTRPRARLESHRHRGPSCHGSVADPARWGAGPAACCSRRARSRSQPRHIRLGCATTPRARGGASDRTERDPECALRFAPAPRPSCHGSALPPAAAPALRLLYATLLSVRSICYAAASCRLGCATIPPAQGKTQSRDTSTSAFISDL
jgi:hypothetical protein